jgi:signal transduction histidine kinase/DNA-binding response OmpR family regulator
MDNVETISPGAGRRFWYQSIAGKLISAFVLVAALTVAATLVAIYQFGNIDAVMTRLTESSLPRVKHSLAVESNAKAIAAGGVQLAAAASETERFRRMSESTEQISKLWTNLSELRSIVGDTYAIIQLQSLIASIDERLGQLDRTVQERIALVAARDRAFNNISVNIEAMATALAPQVRSSVLSDPVLVEAVYQLRTDAYSAAALLYQVPAIDKAETISRLQKSFDEVRDRLLAGQWASAARGAATDQTLSRITEAVRKLADLGSGKTGLFQLRIDELAQQAAAARLQSSLQHVVTDMEAQVAALVYAAEEEATDSKDLSAAALKNSRFWLIGISFVSLMAAILVVWLFVIGYIVARLRELTRGMVAVASGALDTRIPKRTPDELGDMSGALAVFRDNAREIRVAKDQAEEARLLAEAASRTKSAFLANMSHELRTPLNAIIGYSEILHEDAADRGDTASQADLVKIQSAGKHLLGLINDILDLSKIESGRMDIHLEDVDLGKLVSEVRVLVAPLMGKNANSLQVEMPADIGVMRVDAVKLKQSLINLLSNAAKFTKQGLVTLAVQRVASDNPDGLVTFAVTDSGIGMTEEQMGRLFQAFTQADATTTRNYGGTGLGLTITKHFCTMLGGSIDVTSKPGEGSTFTITLPDAAKREQAMPSVEAPRISGAVTGKTVLVVDDDPAVHDVLRGTLVKEGYRLLHAYDGAEALKIAHDDPPDVITLDVMMPQLDGWSVLGKLKSDPGLSHIPVIMLTIVDERTMGYSLGAAEYMTKPVDRARLLELLRRFAAKTREAVILVVDDDPDVRGIVKSTVEKVGLKAAEAGNGQAALDWLKANSPPDLILLDLMMPVMDGFEFLDKVKQIAAVRRVPIVVLTAKDLTDTERNVINERTMLVLTKGAQPLSSLGSALSSIARQPHETAHEKISE